MPVAMSVVLSSASWDEFSHFGSHHDMLVEIRIQNAYSNVVFWMGLPCHLSLWKLLRILYKVKVNCLAYVISVLQLSTVQSIFFPNMQ